MEIFGIFITFCLFKIGTNSPTNSSSTYEQFLTSLGVDLRMDETKIVQMGELLQGQMTMAGCIKRHPKSIFLDPFQLNQFSDNITISSQVKCLQIKQTVINQVSNLSFSSLRNLEFLKVEINTTLQEVNYFLHKNIKYLTLHGYSHYENLRHDRTYNKECEKYLHNNGKLDLKLFERVISDEKKFTYSNDNVFHLELENLQTLMINDVIFNKNNVKFVINTSSEKLAHLFLLRIFNMTDVDHHFVNTKNLTLLAIQDCNLRYYKSSPNHKLITHLFLLENYFFTIYSDSLDFQHHPNLKFLRIELCHIYRFSKDTLKFNKKLRFLELSRNKLSVLHKDTFKSNTELEMLNLESNDFKKVPNLRIKSLKKLYMSYNKITKLKEDSFNDLENLQILFLNDNVIKYVHHKTFVNLSNLLILNISNNKLHVFLYQSPLKLKYLNVAGNKIPSKNYVIIDLGNGTLKYNDMLDF